MKPSELYSREPESVEYDVYHLMGCYYNHVPEVDSFYLDYDAVEKTKRVETHIYKYVSFDGRRIWQLAGIYFDGKPVMITQNAGREGDDHSARFITDVTQYKQMVGFIQSMCKEDEISDVVDVDEDIENLDSFYNHRLDNEAGFTETIQAYNNLRNL